jgi:sugar lactone lactonase YvrE
MYRVSCIFLGNNLRWNQKGGVVAGTSEGTGCDQLNNPTCLHIDSNDILYICDYDNNRIQMWKQGAISGETVAGSKIAIAGSTSTLLKLPTDVVFDKNGCMYVADYDNHRVQRFSPNSITGTTITGVTTKSSAFTDLNQIIAVDVDDNFNVYTLDTYNKQVVQWAPKATSSTVVISSDLFGGACDILLAFGSSNEVYISDEDHNKIYLWKFGAFSPILTLSAVSTGSSTLNKPRGMALDRYGNLYVADSGNNRVVMYCVKSTVGIVVAVNTTPKLDKPIAVALDSHLNLYVAIENGDKVIKFPRL